VDRDALHPETFIVAPMQRYFDLMDRRRSVPYIAANIGDKTLRV
jgi:hypothetical protein